MTAPVQVCKECGELLDPGNMVAAYHKKDGTPTMKGHCRPCGNKLSRQRTLLERLHAHPGPGAPCECCGKAARLNLDHCHITGRFRGWLCRECNLALGLLSDDLRGVQNAMSYLLRAESTPPETPDRARRAEPSETPPVTPDRDRGVN